MKAAIRYHVEAIGLSRAGRDVALVTTKRACDGRVRDLLHIVGRVNRSRLRHRRSESLVDRRSRDAGERRKRVAGCGLWLFAANRVDSAVKLDLDLAGATKLRVDLSFEELEAGFESGYTSAKGVSWYLGTDHKNEAYRTEHWRRCPQ